MLNTAPDGFVIWDELAVHQPRVFTSLVHVDKTNELIESQPFVINRPGIKLSGTVVAPTGARLKVEPTTEARFVSLLKLEPYLGDTFSIPEKPGC